MTTNSPWGALLQVAAMASLLSAVTTAVLVFGPTVPLPEGIAEQAKLHDDAAYLYRHWVLFFHPQFAFVGSLGAATLLWRTRPALVSLSVFYLLVWATTEMTQQAYVIDALNQFWRPSLLAADTDTQRTLYETLIQGLGAISDSQYFVLLFGFGLGTGLLGAAFLCRDTLSTIIGITLIAIGLLSLSAFAGYYAGAQWVLPYTGWIYANLYGVIQTGVRLALAFWLWREWRALKAPEGRV